MHLFVIYDQKKNFASSIFEFVRSGFQFDEWKCWLFAFNSGNLKVIFFTVNPVKFLSHTQTQIKLKMKEKNDNK